MGSASNKSCAASARAITLKMLRRKRFRKPPKIIVPQGQPQAHAQVRRFKKHNSNLLTAQTALDGYGTKPLFKTNYARYQINKQIIDFL